jgi:hypothetical protein
MEDPRKRARVEAYYDAHPELQEQTAEGLMRLEEEAFELLQRDDAECLTLSPGEVAPWLAVLMERMDDLVAQVREAEERRAQPDPEIIQEMRETMADVTEEMAPAVYTPERVDQLVTDLEDYRRSLEKAGESEAAAWAQGAQMTLQHDVPPADNRFLLALCFVSLRAFMRNAMEAAAAAREDSGETPHTAA